MGILGEEDKGLTGKQLSPLVSHFPLTLLVVIPIVMHHIDFGMKLADGVSSG